MNKYFFLAFIISSCEVISQTTEKKPLETRPTEAFKDTLSTIFSTRPDFLSDGFDFPVGKPHAQGYYNAQAFGKNAHLGEDWNANTGGNSDLGDPIFAIANGYVSEATDIQGGWGNIIRIIHCTDTSTSSCNESLYAHCDSVLVSKGDWVKRGDQIGTIGDAHGQYYAHLHFELRHTPHLPLGPGYSSDTTGYVHPTNYIEAHRPVVPDR